MNLRSRRITATLNLSGNGLEYGPLHATVAQKSPTCRVKYVDFTDRQSLVKKYELDPNVDTNSIPEIDIVTNGNPIGRFVEKATQDFIIASHVLEHVPDFVGWIKENLMLLRPGGRIAVAFPDRRYCFDIARNPTLFSDLVSAHLEERTKPSFAQICDHFINVRKVDVTEAWSGGKKPEDFEPVHPTDSILDVLRNLRQRNEYVDIHCWKFSDMEILDILEMVKKSFNLNFQVIGFFPVQKNSHEFYFSLEKTN